MLKTRIITGVVLLVAFIADLFFASFAIFALILGFVVAAAAWEWGRLCGIVNENLQSVYASLVGVLALVALYVPYNEMFIRWLLLAALIFWLIVPALFYLFPRLAAIDAPDLRLLALGFFLFSASAVSIQYLRSFAPEGSAWLLFYALSIVWLMDIGAYFSGKKFGKNKLAPLISPGKTWEGVYGGLTVTAVLFIVVAFTVDWAHGNLWKLLVATFMAAVFSVVGDLYESRIKRAANRKDSSRLLPGHGGVLDRIDGVIAAVPVFAFFWAWL